MYRFSAALLQVQFGDVDTAVVTLVFQNGCIGVIDNSRRATYGYDQRVEVFGSRGALSCSNDTPTSVILSNESSVSGDKPLYFFLERYHQAFLDEMNAFFDAVIDKKPSPVGDIDGLKPLLMGLAAKKSQAEGRPNGAGAPALPPALVGKGGERTEPSIHA